jgi:hypothetical protein
MVSRNTCRFLTVPAAAVPVCNVARALLAGVGFGAVMSKSKMVTVSLKAPIIQQCGLQCT